MTSTSAPIPGEPAGSEYDVAIVGAGPTGLYLALALGRKGYQVIVLEKQVQAYGRPRAVAYDDEVGRLFGAVGIGDDVRALSELGGDYAWYTADHQLLLRFPGGHLGPSGWPIGCNFNLPELEDVLEAHVAAEPTVTLRRGKRSPS